MSTPQNPLPQFTEPISVLLVDDDCEFRKGLQFLLTFYNSTNSAQFDIVGHAASVEQALVLLKQQSPSLVLLDLELAQDTGIDFLLQKRNLSHQKKDSAVLVVSAHREDEMIYRAMQAGAHGYVFKEDLSFQLYDAIATVMQDGVYLSPETTTSFFRMFNFYSGNGISHQPKAKPKIHLTKREKHVLQLVVEGKSNEAIAQTLVITVGTVKCYLTTIFDKLKVKNRTEAAMKALKLGLI
ncbi:MAG: response regulator transcription factor [Leptolyngbyaceae bacterium]|nr:response regulator transcription factor [Leptolyngbyaceae bacterium]